MTAWLRVVTLFCLCSGGGLLALDALGAAPLLALVGPVSVERTLTMIAGLFFCVALTTASARLLLGEHDSAPDLELAPD
jgi:hypothetical protein